MVMRRLLLAALILAAVRANAHPSVSVVIDSRGNIYYSDLAQVWRITPSGGQSVAVPHVHTHELFLDAADNLYGENLWYDNPRWMHEFWRRGPDGRVERIVAAHETFKDENDPSLVRDRAGHHYWAKKPSGPIMKDRGVLARGPFRDIRFMTATPEGTVYFIDTFDLMRVTPDGRVTTLARNLTTEDLIPSRAHNQLLGLWTDRAGTVYVADYKDNVVKRVAPNGATTIAARSRWPWSVCGGAFAPNGDLWLLELNLVNQARVRRVGR